MMPMQGLIENRARVSPPLALEALRNSDGRRQAGGLPLLSAAIRHPYNHFIVVFTSPQTAGPRTVLYKTITHRNF